MRYRLSLALSAFALIAAAIPARADIITFSTGTFSVTSGTPISFGPFPVGAGTAYGASVTGNWTAGPGDPWSSELQLSLTDPTNTQSPFFRAGGVDDGNPYTFPGSSLTLGGANGSMPYYAGVAAGGNWSVRFDTAFSGSTANVANSSVSLYYSSALIPSYNYTGTTVGAPTFQRPDQDGAPTTDPALIVPYSVQSINVNTTGRYLLGTEVGANDSFLLLYANSFDPSNPTANLVEADDDGFGGFTGPNSTSEFTALLAAGTNYFLVNTSFSNSGSGGTGFAFNNVVVGAGSVNVVPEPTSLALLGIGAGGFAWRRWRKKA